MPIPTVTRDPDASPRTRRAFDQLNTLLPTFSQRMEQSTTSAGNVAATETTLMSYTLPANELSLGDCLMFEACGTFAATAATNKRIKATFGATTFYDSSTLAITTANTWLIRGTIARSALAAQKCDLTIVTSSSVLVAKAARANAAEAMDAVVLLLLTGNGTNANDVVLERFYVWKLPA